MGPAFSNACATATATSLAVAAFGSFIRMDRPGRYTLQTSHVSAGLDSESTFSQPLKLLSAPAPPLLPVQSKMTRRILACEGFFIGGSIFTQAPASFMVLGAGAPSRMEALTAG